MRKRPWMIILAAIPVCLLLAVLLYQLPPVYEWLSWRVQTLWTEIRYAFSPPGEAVFIPQEAPTMVASLAFLTPTPSVTIALTPTFPGPTVTPSPSPTSTFSPTPIPEKVELKGTIHEYQQMNNCGPATLSMALSFWGWQGDQRDTRAVLRPNFATKDDKNVSPIEMVNYVNAQTHLKAFARVGGGVDLLKRLIAAGFPVIIEKGFQPPKEDWMGHYELLTGYDDARGRFITQDSYIMPDFPLPYEDVAERWWRDFNHVYVIVYPAERQEEVLAVLGPHADSIENYRSAAEKAQKEIDLLAGRELFFAWYNLGTNLLALGDDSAAAQAYDRAFEVYPTVPESERPWRMLWYQVGPYQAYFQTGRYQDVINLANQTLSFLGSPVLEETLYWRGLAKEASGDLDGAIADLTSAANINPTSTDVLDQLQRLGVNYP